MKSYNPHTAGETSTHCYNSTAADHHHPFQNPSNSHSNNHIHNNNNNDTNNNTASFENSGTPSDSSIILPERMDLGGIALRTSARPKSTNLRSEIPTKGLGHDMASVGRNASLRQQHRSCSSSMQAFESAGQHDSGAISGYVRWPSVQNRTGSAEEREAYFKELPRVIKLNSPNPPEGRQARTLLELMNIRAYYGRTLKTYSIGTALGLRTRNGQLLVDTPAIIVFVTRKVHEQWLLESQKLPTILHGPEGFWCDVDVVEFSHYGSTSVAPREQVYDDLVERLRGRDPVIGPGSQIASEEMYGTLSAVVRSRRDKREPGFLTNRHVAVDFDQPKQKMYHPLPPSLGPGMYLGSVERAASYASDHAWYGVFAGKTPETFVRADGAFIPFWENVDLDRVTTMIRGIGPMGEVYTTDLQHEVKSLIGKKVSKVGGSSGLTKGTIMAYCVEYYDDKSVCYFTDFLILGENNKPFDIEGDSGSLIVLDQEYSDKVQPIGIIWGGTANRGRLKLRTGTGPENWTSGVDIARLLDLLELDLITSKEELIAVAGQQRGNSGSSSSTSTPPDTRDYETEGSVERQESNAMTNLESTGDQVSTDVQSAVVPIQHSLLQPDSRTTDNENKAKRPRVDQ